MKFTILATLLLIHTTFALKSGIYVDNGFNATVLQDPLSKEEIRQVEYQLLDMLGIGKKPKPIHAHSLRYVLIFACDFCIHLFVCV